MKEITIKLGELPQGRGFVRGPDSTMYHNGYTYLVDENAYFYLRLRVDDWHENMEIARAHA